MEELLSHKEALPLLLQNEVYIKKLLHLFYTSIDQQNMEGWYFYASLLKDSYFSKMYAC